MDRSKCLALGFGWLLLVIVNTGCGGTVSSGGGPPAETRMEQVDHYCGDAGLSDSLINDGLEASQLDLYNGFSYDDEIDGVVSGCSSGCSELIDDNEYNYCFTLCYGCAVAIVNAVYYPDQ